jgi:hypothetical protein
MGKSWFLDRSACLRAADGSGGMPEGGREDMLPMVESSTTTSEFYAECESHSKTLERLETHAFAVPIHKQWQTIEAKH